MVVVSQHISYILIEFTNLGEALNDNNNIIIIILIIIIMIIIIIIT